MTPQIAEFYRLAILMGVIKAPRFPVPREPWQDVHLTKAERKGRTPEELQAIRKQKLAQYQQTARTA